MGQPGMGDDERTLGEKNFDGRVGEGRNLPDPGTGSIDDLFRLDGLLSFRKDVLNSYGLNFSITDCKA